MMPKPIWVVGHGGVRYRCAHRSNAGQKEAEHDQRPVVFCFGGRSLLVLLATWVESPILLSALPPETSRPLLERADRAQEVDFAELRPVDICEIKLALGALP
jgi:hypothetical protein